MTKSEVEIMFPNHCKEVAVKRVDFSLTSEVIMENLKGKKAYKRTRFIALNNGEEWAVVRIEKDQEEEIFGTIINVDVLSLPHSTMYYEDNELNVLSPTMMAEKANEMGCETLIVKGKFEHVSFIHKENMQPLLVYEVVPPQPPKLVELVKSAIHVGNVKKPVKMMFNIMDLTELAKKSERDIIVFPCKASSLIDERKTLYLDELPELSQGESLKVALVGCDLSLRIFKEHYNFEPEFHNFCPQKWAEKESSETKAIVKCCQVKEGHLFSKNIAVVPWGATQREVEDAINHLLGQ